MVHSGQRARAVEDLLAFVGEVDRMVLVQLAERGKRSDLPPAFRGRCLDPAYLDAVAAGTWSLDDEALLARAEERAEALTLPRVRRLDRRGLRAVLRGALLTLLTADLGVSGWEARRAQLRAPWEDVVGALADAPRVAVAR